MASHINTVNKTFDAVDASVDFKGAGGHGGNVTSANWEPA
jgi:hypothetical protein